MVGSTSVQRCQLELESDESFMMHALRLAPTEAGSSTGQGFKFDTL